MNKNQRLLLIAGGAVAAVLAMVLVAVWLLGGRAGDQNAGMFARLQSGLSAVTSGLTPPPLEAARDCAFRRLEIDVTKPQAEACLVLHTGQLHRPRRRQWTGRRQYCASGRRRSIHRQWHDRGLHSRTRQR